MTKVVLLEELAKYTKEKTKDLLMPVKPQKGDIGELYISANVYKMRIPDGKSATKKAPYILHQIVTGEDSQITGNLCDAYTTVRSIFCVYNENDEEGGMMLLNLMERFRISILEDFVIGKQFTLNLEGNGIQSLIYPDDTAPFFIGEMITVWKIPTVQRKVIL